MSSKNHKNQTLMFRYLLLRSRGQSGEEVAADELGGDYPPLNELFESAWCEFDTVGKRHVPPLKDGKPEDGKRYVVPLLKRVHKKSGAVWLRVCVYTGGEWPGFAPKDLDASEAEVSYQQVTDNDGEELVPGVEFSVLLLGRTALIQNRQGVGAANAVQRIVHRFGRQACGNAMVRPEFVAVTPQSIAKQIRDAGGVVAVSFGIAETQAESGASVNLHELQDRVGGAKTRVTIRNTGDATLDAEESQRLYEHHEDEGLENVTLHLKDKQTISGKKMTLAKPVKVPLTNGVPDCNQVDAELLRYLQELMTIDEDGEQSISSTGHIGPKLKIVITPTRR